jgi:hypothetical protein
LPAAQHCHKPAPVASRGESGVARQDGGREHGEGDGSAAAARGSNPRAERLARALRANLRRRKEQSRARAAAGPEPADPGTVDRRSDDG